MANKKSIIEKIITTHKIDLECTLNVSDLPDEVLIGEFEDEGEKDLKKFFKKFDGEYIKISITNKIDETPED